MGRRSWGALWDKWPSVQSSGCPGVPGLPAGRSQDFTPGSSPPDPAVSWVGGRRRGHGARVPPDPHLGLTPCCCAFKKPAYPGAAGPPNMLAGKVVEKNGWRRLPMTTCGRPGGAGPRLASQWRGAGGACAAGLVAPEGRFK